MDRQASERALGSRSVGQRTAMRCWVSWKLTVGGIEGMPFSMPVISLTLAASVEHFQLPPMMKVRPAPASLRPLRSPCKPAIVSLIGWSSRESTAGLTDS